MTRIMTVLVLVLMMICMVFCAGAEHSGRSTAAAIDSEGVFQDLLALNLSLDTKEKETAELDETLALDIAKEWGKIYLESDYPVYLYGMDEPEVLEIRGRHAFVVLGFELADGEMTEELKGRCNAAAAAAEAFPESILVCSGGATGENNPEGHTEAGLMKQYLAETCGIEAGRIFTDEQAMTTAENAINTFAILKEQGIDSITIVTSSYHQCRAHMLYYTLADWYSRMDDWTVELIGNFSFETEGDAVLGEMDAFIAEFQIREILQILCSV